MTRLLITAALFAIAIWLCAFYAAKAVAHQQVERVDAVVEHMLEGGAR